MRFMDENPPIHMDEGYFMDDDSDPTNQRRQKMSKVKTDMRHLDPDGLTGKGDAVTAAMTGNANFPTATTLLTRLGGHLTAAKAKIVTQKNAQKAAQQTTIDRDDALAPVKQDLMDIAALVQQVSSGNAAIIETSGFDVASSTHSPAGKLSQVQNLSLSTGDNPGDADAHWDGVDGSHGYEHMLCIGDPMTEANWKMTDGSTGSKTTYSGLSSGTRIWARVRAKAPKKENNGAWSQPATIIVP